MQFIEHYPSLFLVASGHSAKWYKVIDKDKTELVYVKNKEEIKYSDKEGRFSGDGGQLISEDDDNNAKRKEEQELNIKAILEETLKLWKEEDYQHFCMSVPENLKNMFIDELKSALVDIPIMYVSGNFVNSDKEQIIEEFHKSLKVV